MRTRLLFASLAVFLLPAAAVFAQAEKPERFAVYYADSEPLDHFRPYQLLVFDSIHHPPLPPLKEEGKVMLGYVSLGEIDKNSPHYAALKAKNLILQENNNWKGSYFIDVRDPVWAKIVVEEIVPAVLRQGFDGVFLDTLDSAIELDDVNPEKYAGMNAAASHIIEAIRQQYPSIKIMMNRGYSLLPAVDHFIDYALGESVYADYDFATKTYRKVDEKMYKDQKQVLQDAMEDNPELKIYTLDYANPADQATIEEIYRTERANGFIPYVATIGLDRLVAEPGSN